MLSFRLWSVRHARGLRQAYDYASKLAPLVAPLARTLGTARTEAALTPLERISKSLMFDCRMCGQCVLSATGMACPMNCAKEMRNGPCGGVRADGNCEVNTAMRCVWVEATNGNRRIAGDRQAHPTPLLPAIDQRKRGRSSWIHVIHGEPEPVFQPLVGGRVTPTARQGQLEQACNSGRFVVTVEVAPPDSADPQTLLAKAAPFCSMIWAVWA